MAAQGFALCGLGPKWEFRPFHYSCNEFKPEKDADVLRRIDWLRKKKIVK